MTGQDNVVQDGLKLPFLCNDCEQLFCKYEVNFKKTIYDKLVEGTDNDVLLCDENIIRFLILSIAWRYMQYRLEEYEDKLMKMPEGVLDILKSMPYYGLKIQDMIDNQIVEKWRIWLLSESHKDIEKMQMHVIPIDKIECLKNLKKYEILSWSMGLDLFKIKNSDYVNLKLPGLILLCQYKGEANILDMFKVSNVINFTINERDLTNEFWDVAIKNTEPLNKVLNRNV